MFWNVIVCFLIVGLFIWRLSQKKELFLKLPLGERIYTTLVYLFSLIIIFLGGSKLMTWIQTFELNGIAEALTFFSVLAILLGFIVTIWTKILPKKVIKDISDL